MKNSKQPNTNDRHITSSFPNTIQYTVLYRRYIAHYLVTSVLYGILINSSLLPLLTSAFSDWDHTVWFLSINLPNRLDMQRINYGFTVHLEPIELIWRDHTVWFLVWKSDSSKKCRKHDLSTSLDLVWDKKNTSEINTSVWRIEITHEPYFTAHSSTYVHYSIIVGCVFLMVIWP